MQAETQVKVWDIFVRVFHWTLVVAFFIAYFTEDDLLGVHTWAGYTVAGLVLARLVWGLIGSRHARFTDFVYPLRVVKEYLRDVMRLRPQRYLGHNPAGGLMIVALLVSLLATTFTGMGIYAIEHQAGPLAGWLGQAGHTMKEIFEGAHEFFANFTLFLVVVHVTGVVVESVLHGENLVRAMISGRKGIRE